jgi:hypothetical protein
MQLELTPHDDALERFRQLGLPDLETLGERIDWILQRKSVTGNTLGLSIGMTGAVISRLKTVPGAQMEAPTAFKLERVTGVPAQWIVCGYADPLKLKTLRSPGQQLLTAK